LSKEKFLGLDFGEKRIGFSVSDDTNTIAFGRGVFLNNSSFFNELNKLLRSENITHIIIGYPLNLSGRKTVISEKVEKFKNEIETFLSKNQLEIKVLLFDERLTSKIATDSMLLSGMKKSKRQDKQNIDIISAALILQDYLDSRKV
jgi:putative Holliday junction resolvase